MSLVNQSAHLDHLSEQLRPAAQALPGDAREAFISTLANVLAGLDHRLRLEADQELGRLESRIEEELREFAEAEQ